MASATEPFKFVPGSTAASSKRPLVVLLAWMAAKPEHVQKYAEMVSSIGLDSLVVIGDPYDLHFSRANVRRLAHKVLQEIQDGFAGRPVVFAAFSNGGAVPLYHIRDLLRHKEYEVDVRGIIFDSSPCKVTAHSAGTALSCVAGASPLAQALAYWASYAVTCFNLVVHGETTAAFHHESETAPVACPELYIFSEEDAITDAAWVQSIVARRQGVSKHRVRSYRFHDSPHVLHFRHHPKLYRRCWQRFLQEDAGIDLGLASFPPVDTHDPDGPVDGIPEAALQL